MEFEKWLSANGLQEKIFNGDSFLLFRTDKNQSGKMIMVNTMPYQTK